MRTKTKPVKGPKPKLKVRDLKTKRDAKGGAVDGEFQDKDHKERSGR